MTATGTGEVMPIVEHLRELRRRIVRSILAVGVAATVLMLWYEPFKDLLTKPYRDLCASDPSFGCDGSLYSLGPLDGFSARLRIAGYGGLVLALPVVLWQIWRFILPALNRREKQYAVPFITSSLVLFAAGSTLGYWTIGKGLEFLIAWSGEDITQAYQITKYVQLVLMMMLAFGAGFLSPVLVVFLQVASIVQPRTLVVQWRYAIMAIFLAAAVITPDGSPVSLFTLAVPLLVLYFLAVLVGWLIVRRRVPAA